MANGDPITALLKVVLGDVPARGAVRLILVGALGTLAFVGVRDWATSFEKRVFTEAAAVRLELSASIKADSLNMESNRDVRAKLMRKVNARLHRLYIHNAWEYEDIEP